MDKLISAEKLYNKITEIEELARNRVLDTPITSPTYMRYVAQLNERTALKHMIMDEPAAFDKEKVIEELENATGDIHFTEDGSFNGKFIEDFYFIQAKTAIEIVEKGGIE